LDQPSLTVCTMQLCRKGVEFVSRPSTDRPKVMIHLHKLPGLRDFLKPTTRARAIFSEYSRNQLRDHGIMLAHEVIVRIDRRLARGINAAKIVFVVDFGEGESWFRGCRVNETRIFTIIHNHFKTRPRLSVEWHARTKSSSKFRVIPILHALDVSYSNTYVCTETYRASFAALHTLNLRKTQVSDVSVLESCHALHTLNLSYTLVRDVTALASCPALHTLNLRESKVRDVSVLESCQSLHTVDLNYTKVSDVTALASCPALHTLNLRETQVSDVSVLAACTALHTLDLKGTQVSDVSSLASCQSLHTLDIDGTQVSDVSALASCQSLHTLDLNYTKVSDVSVLASCRSLRNLWGIEGVVGGTDVLRTIRDRAAPKC
jgi:Leucine-rich repeat (LRR) protein